MKIVTLRSDILSLGCKSLGKWGMAMSFPDVEKEELLKIAPFLSQEEFGVVRATGNGFIFCETKEEVFGFYNQIAGKDGVVVADPNTSDLQGFAVVCDPTGAMAMENL